MIKLTNSEQEVMNLLWSSEEPLSSRDIIKQSSNKSWKDSYVHLLINSLLEKNMIEVSGFKQATKNYTRVFSPSISREQWLISQIDDKNGSHDLILCLFKEILQRIDDPEELNRLADYLEEIKKRTK